MKINLSVVVCLLLAGAGAASAGEYQQGLAYKKDQKLPEAAEVFESLVRKNPRDADSLEQLATVQGWLGRNGDAIHNWERALTLRPNSLEDRVGLARVCYWSGDYARALEEIGRILNKQPRNIDALVLQGDVLAASGEMRRARASYQAAQAISPRDPEIAKKLGRAVRPLSWRLDFGYVHDHFNNSRQEEFSAYTQLGYRFSERANIWARHDYLSQFGTVDHMTQIGGAYQARHDLLLLPSIGFTRKPHFRPTYQADMGAEYSIPQNVTLLLNLRYFKYTGGSVRMTIPGIRVQPTPWANLEYRYSFSHNTDATTTRMFSLRMNFLYEDRFAPYIGYAHGREDIPPQASARVTYYSTGCVWNINARYSVRGDLTFEDRPLFYDHTSEGVGATVRF
jgi:YaiO family outer membrane protein